jgi:hypothetical protein
MNAGVIVGKNGGTCLKLRLGAFEGIWCLNDMSAHEMNPASRAWKDVMLGQGRENSAGEKGGTRETERLSGNELTFTDLTKKGGHSPIPSPAPATPRPTTPIHLLSLPLTTPRCTIPSLKHKHARGHCIGIRLLF